MNILITGVTGNVGSFLAADLIKNGHTVVGLARTGENTAIVTDIRKLSPQTAADLLTRHSIDVIVHCAASLSPATAEEMLLNSYGLQPFFSTELGRSKKYIVFGSQAEYGLQDNPMTELTPPLGQTAYAASKLLQTTLCLYYHQAFEVDVSVLRVSNIIHPSLPVSSFIGAVMHACAQGADGQVTVNSLAIERDFIDIRDIASLVRSIIGTELSKQSKAVVYNVGSGTNCSYGAVIDMMSRILAQANIRQPQIQDKKQAESFSRGALVIQTVHDELNWKPQISLEESLRWCLQSREIIPL